jgi:hypothetical protein
MLYDEEDVLLRWQKNKVILIQKYLERLSLRKPRHKEGVLSVELKNRFRNVD